MKLAVFSTKDYDRRFFDAARRAAVDVVYHALPLRHDTAELAHGADAVCVSVRDSLSAAPPRPHGGQRADVCTRGCRRVRSRARLDAQSAPPSGLQPCPRRLRDGNFTLDGLLGHTLHGKTMGLVGTGHIGAAMARIAYGLGCRVLACDHRPKLDLAGLVEYRPLDRLLPECDIVSLHLPLGDSTHHLINADSIALMKRGVMLVNTSRGGLVDTAAVLDALKSGQVGSFGLDVYENEDGLFDQDHSSLVIHDDLLMRLTTFPNVVVCSHQAFFTEEAVAEIAQCTMRNLEEFAATGTCANSLVPRPT
ncbi:hypothetical protein XA68_10009 [Ophiocordyceps unilateralis]|uniref:D-isomer specific 2-hydroxyacid dehydrogenase NAD-binding domain-containing protein n=1 Tax=Ophiocordyceps unilateralis TaxID=268505 RepID=A0A2A9PV23_OPHUN|nr:hypothetical protein XA68_10009 [Ophiocordyceps unilateralis]